MSIYSFSIGYAYAYEPQDFPTAQMVKNLPATQEIWVRSLGQEDPLEKEMAIHSSTLAWKIPWTEESGRPQSMGSQRVRHNQVTNTHEHRLTHMSIPTPPLLHST